jgi:hypothetical protein
VRAKCVNREYLSCAAHEQHLSITAMADQLAAVGEIRKRDTPRQVRPGRPCVLMSHCLLSWASAIVLALHA